MIYQSDDKLVILVDGCKIDEIDNLLMGIACLIAAYWVFDIQFPAYMKNSLSFISKHILEIEVPVSQPVVRFMNKL